MYRTAAMILPLLLCCTAISVAQSEAKPNVIVIFTDDHGWADLGCQGSRPDVKTPNLDRFAAEGVRMTNGYSTAPQCVPSRAGIISGQYQQRIGVDHNGMGPMPLDVLTLPDRMRSAGYTTGMVGKWHLDPNASCVGWVAENLPAEARRGRNTRIPAQLSALYQPGRRGFDEFFCGQMTSYAANYALDGSSLSPEGQRVQTTGYRLDTQTQAAVAFIDRNHASPFFLYLGYYAPHVPLEATEKYLSRFPGDMPERRRYALAMISAMDDGVGQIIDELKSHEIDEKTLLFFISDNGAPLKISMEDLPVSMPGGAWDGSRNDPWVGEKGMLTEGGIRVPYLMRWKGTLPEGLVYEEQVISLDVAATATAMAGLPETAELDGTNLIPYLTGNAKGVPHESLFWRFWGQAAVRSGKWKLLHLGDGSEYLFDLESPKHEHENLLDKRPETADRLRRQLSDWTAELQEPGLPAEGLNAQERPWYGHFLGWKPGD